MPKVSIIVPAYNAEKTIARCIDSILGQDYADFELIVVDDGSTDGTPEILDSYAEKDGRVQVIHKANSGVSDSRNRALDVMRGTYVQFLDADDWIAPEATRLLVHAMEDHDADLVISDFYRVIGKKVSRKGDISEDGVLTREEFGDYMMEDPSDFYYGVLWNKLYRADIINAHDLRMDVTLSWCEDFIFNMEYELHCKRIYALQVPIYYYVKTRGSLVSQGASLVSTVQMKLNVIQYYNEFYKQVLDEEDYKTRRPDIYRFYIESASDGSIMPWQRRSKLGEERVAVFDNETMEADDLVAWYYEGKLIERSFEIVAAQFELDARDVRVLDLCRLTGTWSSREELADFADLGSVQLARSLARLASKGLITVKTEKEDGTAAAGAPDEAEEDAEAARDDVSSAPKGKAQKPRRVYKIDVTDEAQPAIDAIKRALKNCDRVRCLGMDDAEAGRFRASMQKAVASIRQTLGPGSASQV